uniref:Uncharacterized protein n=1 Tax=Heterorhabditis bacteriophora TaxID=37862 RepID=A0A1I7XQ47_HETBA
MSRGPLCCCCLSSNVRHIVLFVTTLSISSLFANLILYNLTAVLHTDISKELKPVSSLDSLHEYSIWHGEYYFILHIFFLLNLNYIYMSLMRLMSLIYMLFHMLVVSRRFIDRLKRSSNFTGNKEKTAEVYTDELTTINDISDGRLKIYNKQLPCERNPDDGHPILPPDYQAIVDEEMPSTEPPSKKTEKPRLIFFTDSSTVATTNVNQMTTDGLVTSTPVNVIAEEVRKAIEKFETKDKDKDDSYKPLLDGNEKDADGSNK